MGVIMQKAQLIIDFSNLVGPAGKGVEVSNTGLDIWLNDAYFQAVSAINETIPDFYTKLQTASTVATQGEYILPTDFEKAVMVSISYDGVNWVRALPLNNIGQALDIQRSNSSNFDQSQPFYYIFKNKIGFLPVPTETLSNNIKLWYAYNPTELALDADEPDLPRRIQSILKYSMYANYLDQNDEHAAAERMRQRFDVQLERLVAQLADQQVDQPKTVEIDSDDQGLYLNEF